jgi:hypothetical protein
MESTTAMDFGDGIPDYRLANSERIQGRVDGENEFIECRRSSVTNYVAA